MLFGHLNPATFPSVGVNLRKGEEFAKFGDMEQNGNWFYHTHLQILTQIAYDKGWRTKGYCKESEILIIDEYCPNPFNYL
jgi:hypothetical protein